MDKPSQATATFHIGIARMDTTGEFPHCPSPEPGFQRRSAFAKSSESRTACARASVVALTLAAAPADAQAPRRAPRSPESIESAADRCTDRVEVGAGSTEGPSLNVVSADAGWRRSRDADGCRPALQPVAVVWDATQTPPATNGARLYVEERIAGRAKRVDVVCARSQSVMNRHENCIATDSARVWSWARPLPDEVEQAVRSKAGATVQGRSAK
jgi:hypothetical protein